MHSGAASPEDRTPEEPDEAHFLQEKRPELPRSGDPGMTVAEIVSPKEARSHRPFGQIVFRDRR